MNQRSPVGKALRLDNIRLDADNVVWAETPEGYLKFENLVATTTGDFPYRKDGKIVYEKRLPEEVFKQDHLDSFVGKSITLLDSLGHPKELLNPENDAKYSVGTILSAERKDENKLAIAGVVKEPTAIEKIKSNIISSKDKRVDAYEGSCGYTLELDGLTQRNLHLNHFSFVHKGRAGAITKINRDYDDTEEDGQNSDNSNSEANQKTNDNNSNNINSSADMSDELLKERQALETQLAEANAKLDAATKAQEADSVAKKELQTKVDSLTTRIDAMDSSNKKKELIEKAHALGIKLDEVLKDVNFDEISPRDLSIKIINSVKPDIKLDSASDDIILGVLLGMQPVNVRNDSLYGSFGVVSQSTVPQKNPEESARDGVLAGIAEFEKSKNNK